MNKDFHYYGTYYAARFAGYSIANAEEIAWAAQMVDDFTKSNFATLFNHENVTYTCESLSEMVSYPLRSYDDVGTDELQRMRRIWSAFHFLPGNMSNTDVARNGFNIDPKDFSYIRDLPDFKCMCAPNSELVSALVEHARDNPTSNIRIGILMHVIADTWSHQGFCGSPTRTINGVSNIVGDISWLHLPDIGTKYSGLYLGHGQLDHLPDILCLNYSYKPNWSESTVNICNPVRFYNGFAQMIEAMKYIQNPNNLGVPFALKDYWEEAQLGANGIDPYVNDRIVGIFNAHQKDTSDEWVHVFNETVAPCAYSLRTDQPELLLEFEQEALVHLNFVMNYVEQRVPRYFR